MVPGRGIPDVHKTYWYTFVKNKLDENAIFKEVILPEQMPDYEAATEAIWVEWIKSHDIKENDTLMGHSTGAVACLRACETVKCKGLVICAPHWTDLGDDGEKASGYFDREWQWEKIIENCGAITQFSCADDPLIPLEEAHHVKDSLKLCVANENGDYLELFKRGHFDQEIFDEMFIVVLRYGVDDPDADPMKPVVPMPEGFEKTAVPKPLIMGPKTVAFVVLYFALAYYYQ